MRGVVTRDIRFEDVIAQDVRAVTPSGRERRVLFCGPPRRRSCNALRYYGAADTEVSGERVAVNADPRGRPGIYVRDYDPRPRRARTFISLPTLEEYPGIRLAGRFAAASVRARGVGVRIVVYDWARKRRLYTFARRGYSLAFDLQADGQLAVAYRPRAGSQILGRVTPSGRLRVLDRGEFGERVWIAQNRIATHRLRSGRAPVFQVHDLRRRTRRLLEPDGIATLRDFDGRHLLWASTPRGEGMPQRLLIAPVR